MFCCLVSKSYTSLIELTPVFYSLDADVNGIASSTSFMDYSMLGYRNMGNCIFFLHILYLFCIFIIQHCWICLLAQRFICGFCTIFCIYKVMSSADNFAPSFLICMPFIYFSCLNSLATISSTTFNRNGERRIFQSSTIKVKVCWLGMMLVVGFSWMFFIRLKKFLSTSVWVFLSWKATESCWVLFLNLLKWSCSFCPLLIRCMTSIDFLCWNNFAFLG